MPPLHALECLVAVVDSGSVTPAGELRGVKLTSAGRAAVADARRAVEAAESAVRSAIKHIRGQDSVPGAIASFWIGQRTAKNV
jgi:DNA-binding transcriptional LysR family regulator